MCCGQIQPPERYGDWARQRLYLPRLGVYPFRSADEQEPQSGGFPHPALATQNNDFFHDTPWLACLLRFG